MNAGETLEVGSAFVGWARFSWFQVVPGFLLWGGRQLNYIDYLLNEAISIPDLGHLLFIPQLILDWVVGLSLKSF